MAKLLLFMAILPMIYGSGIEVSFSAEGGGGQYASIDSVYDVEENVFVTESATASFDEFGITDIRTVSGKGIYKADQTLATSGAYSSHSSFSSQEFGQLSGNANLKNGCLEVSQNVLASGLSSYASVSAANNGGSASVGCSVNQGSISASQRISMNKPQAVQYASVAGATGSVSSKALDSSGNLAKSGMDLADGYLNSVQEAWTGSAYTCDEIHASADTISAWSQGDYDKKTSRILVNLLGTEVSTAAFDGMISSYAKDSAGAAIDSHVVGVLKSRAEASGLTSSTRSSNGGMVEADLDIYAYTTGDEIFDQAIFYANPSFGIQPAIDAFRTGDEILAGPGIYHERLVINKQINLRGTGKGSDPQTNTIIMNGSDFDPVIAITAGGSSAVDRSVIANLRVIHLSGSNPGMESGAGIEISGSEDISHITLEDLSVVNQGGRADEITIFSGNQRSITDVVLNKISIESTCSEKAGLSIKADGPGSSISEVSLNSLIINANAENSFGVLVQPSDEGRIDDVTIDGGTITSAGEEGNGVAIWSWGETISNVRINGVSITTTGASAKKSYGNSVDVTDFTNSNAIRGVEVHNTNLISKNYGLHSNLIETVNATENWWGDAAGPNALGGSNVSEGVIFDPWSLVPLSPTES